MLRFALPVLLSAVALAGCDAVDDDASRSIGGQWSGVIEMPGESFGGPFTLDLRQVGGTVAGTADWFVAGGDQSVRGTVNGTVPPSGTITYTVDFVLNGSVWGVQRHDVRLDDDVLSGTWVFTSSDEFSVGTVSLTRR